MATTTFVDKNAATDTDGTPIVAEWLNEVDALVHDVFGGAATKEAALNTFNGLSYASDTGAADAYVVAPGAGITAYAAGQLFRFLAGNANTGASTLAVNGLAAKTIKKNFNEDLLAGDIKAGQIISVIYDGSNFQLVDEKLATNLSSTSSSLGAALVGYSGESATVKAALDSRIPTENTYTQLRANLLSYTDGQIVYVKGRSSIGDGGEGHFRVHLTDKSTEVSADEVTSGQGDGGIWVAPTSDLTGASGAAERIGVTVVNVELYGAKGNGTTDDAPALTPSTTYRVRYMGSKAYYHTGITLIEACKLIGELGSLPADATGSRLQYDGTGRAIQADGAWTGFDSRRFIELSEFSLEKTAATAAMEALIWWDFVTLFETKNIYLEGNKLTDYCMYLRNSYNGKISGGRLDGATVANLYMTIDAADPVFSGQALIENVDFWDCTNGTNTGSGTKVDIPTNVMEQIQFNKCHWQSNDIGFHQVDFADITILAAHFEANLTRDVQCDSGSQNLKILSGFCNNAQTTTEAMLFDGINGCLKNFDFIEVTNGANCVTVGANAQGLHIEDVTMRRKSGSTMNGIAVNGDDTIIRNLRAITGGTAATWPVITINSGAKNTRISGLVYENFGSTAPVVDNGENTIFEDARIITSPVWDVNGGSQEEGFYMAESGFINRVWVIYPGGTGSGTATTAQVGRSTAAGTTDYTRYVSHTTPVSAAVYAREVATVSATPFLSAGDVLLLRTPGTSSTAGSLQIIVEMTPYRALT